MSDSPWRREIEAKRNWALSALRFDRGLLVPSAIAHGVALVAVLHTGWSPAIICAFAFALGLSTWLWWEYESICDQCGCVIEDEDDVCTCLECGLTLCQSCLPTENHDCDDEG